MKFTTFAFVALAAFFSCVVAAPTLNSRDVFVPPVLTPKQGDVWTVGQNQTVTWDVSGAPARLTNPHGTIMLRKGDRTLKVTLASGFDILSGAINVTVPAQPAGDDYAIVLFGDSGNFSPRFSIQSTTALS
ncbi:hypothetical protein C8J56DRAFT_339443 [Mycena floridula]|nr:hypothetical protein C8J56DRAFT_339443 [Mycena floridula]